MSEISHDHDQTPLEEAPPTGVDALPEEYRSLAWHARSLLTQLVAIAPEQMLTEALELDRRRRATILQVEPGTIVAAVRESSSRPNRVTITCDSIARDSWVGLLESCVENHALCAQLLAGFVPEDMESIAAHHSLSLVPSLRSAVCKPKHPEGLHLTRAAIATLLALARFLDATPTTLLTLRGMPADEALERLHQRRSLRQSVSGDAPAYVQRPIQLDPPAPPLEMCLDTYWQGGKALETIDTTPRLPEVECPLLRRLGPSPFADSKFPLLGLLATCYNEIARAQVESTDDPGA
ncbi:MAG: hypothetical protein ACF8GE_01395 [Phycisphaerales bacterium JB043]